MLGVPVRAKDVAEARRAKKERRRRNNESASGGERASGSKYGRERSGSNSHGRQRGGAIYSISAEESDGDNNTFSGGWNGGGSAYPDDPVKDSRVISAPNDLLYENLNRFIEWKRNRYYP